MPPVQVQIPSYETTPNGVVIYLVLAVVGNATTSSRKRYTDFQRLNEKLRARRLPQISIPGKLWLHSESSLRDRRIALDKAFRNYLDKRGSNPVIEDFLGFTESSQFEAVETPVVAFTPSVQVIPEDEAVVETAAAASAEKKDGEDSNKPTKKLQPVLKAKKQIDEVDLQVKRSPVLRVALIACAALLAVYARKKAKSTLVGLIVLGGAGMAINAA